jgi:hypothetical protein
MSRFLRDEYLKNLTISEKALEELNEEIIKLSKNEFTQLLAKHGKNNTKYKNKFLMPSYIIRFDGKGFTLYEFKDLKDYFNKAKKVERIIFVLDSVDSMHAIIGKKIEIRFDSYDVNNCFISVQDDEKEWVDSSFTNLREIISKYKNYNWLARSRLAIILLQIMGVFIGFILSLWIAHILSPHFNIQHAFIFAFIAVFLIFSNLWGHIFEGLRWIVNKIWPNIAFKEKKIHWLFQGLLVCIFLWILGKLILSFLSVISQIIK